MSFNEIMSLTMKATTVEYVVLKGIKFRDFLNFRPFSKILYPQTKKSQNQIPAKFEVLLFLIFDLSMILIPVY